MNIAYFGPDAHRVDLQRHILLARALGYEPVEALSRKNINRALNDTGLLITDSCDLKTLIAIKWWQAGGGFSKVSIIILELFTVSFMAWRQELTFLIRQGSFSNWKSILYFIIAIPFRIMLLRMILMSRPSEVIVPSKLRIDFLKAILPKHISYKLLRNMPILSQLNLSTPKDYDSQQTLVKEIVASGKYFFIGGRINVEAEFFSICSYASRNNLSILAATGQTEIVQRAIKQFPGVIISLGKISNDLVMFLSSRCLAGVCLYHSFTSNQKLSASSKLFEFMLMNKPIIASDNPGMQAEIEDEFKHLIIPVDDIKSGVTILQGEAQINKKFSFENEIEIYKNQLNSSPL